MNWNKNNNDNNPWGSGGNNNPWGSRGSGDGPNRRDFEDSFFQLQSVKLLHLRLK